MLRQASLLLALVLCVDGASCWAQTYKGRISRSVSPRDYVLQRPSMDNQANPGTAGEAAVPKGLTIINNNNSYFAMPAVAPAAGPVWNPFDSCDKALEHSRSLERMQMQHEYDMQKARVQHDQDVQKSVLQQDAESDRSAQELNQDFRKAEFLYGLAKDDPRAANVAVGGFGVQPASTNNYTNYLLNTGCSQSQNQTQTQTQTGNSGTTSGTTCGSK
jgi:hypothetical protein